MAVDADRPERCDHLARVRRAAGGARSRRHRASPCAAQALRRDRPPLHAGVLRARQRLPEAPAGTFNEQLARVWDELVALCRRVGLRLLLTPFDTFFTWTNWDAHPYNRANGGPCTGRDRLLTCPTTRSFIKRRLEFATRRWGGDGVIFAWDLWNELHPAQGENRPDLLRGLHRRCRPVAPRPGAGAAWPCPPADRLGVRAGAGVEAVAERADLPPSRARFREQPLLRGRHDRLPDRHGGARDRSGPAGAGGPGRDRRRSPLPGQRARPDPHLQGPRHHAAGGVRRRVFPPSAMGASGVAAAPAAACGGRTATRTS